jgi:hypothetical protein
MDQLVRRHTRREAARRIAVAALALPVALGRRNVGAVIGWCRNDPVIQIDGQTVDVFISSYVDMKTSATGPTQLVVTVPAGIAAALRATDRGFGGHGYDVRFAKSDALSATRSALQVKIEVFAPASDSSLPVKVDFVPRGSGRLTSGSATGTANAWFTLTTG